MRARQQSTTNHPMLIYMVLSIDHLTPATGKTLTVQLNKDGAASSGAAAGAVTEIDSTNMKGWYSLAGNATDRNTLGSLGINVTATGCDVFTDEYQIVGYDPFDSVRMGMTALPNAAAEAAGGLYTRGSGAGQINQPANGQIDANAVKWNGTAVASPDTAGYPVVTVKHGTGTGEINLSSGNVPIQAGTGTGQLDFTSGVVKANLAQILGTALTETAGQIAAGFKKLFDVAAPVFTLLSSLQTGDSYARLGAPAGASVSADVAAVKSDNGAIKTQTDKLAFTVPNQIDANVIDWKGSAAPAMTGDAFARLGAPAGASVSADIAATKTDLDNRTPAALVGGRMDASIGDIPAAALALLFTRDSTKTIDDAIAGSVVGEITSSAGGSAPTVEEIRQEMDANSTQLAGIRVATDRITTGATFVQSQVDSDGNVTIYQAKLQTLTWTSDSPRDLSAGGTAVKLEFDSLSFDAVVSGSVGSWAINVTLTMAQTAKTTMGVGQRRGELAVYVGSNETDALAEFDVVVEPNL